MAEPKSFLSQVKGFTPVIDALAEELGVVTALVYGLVWRYCQQEDRVCSASHETLARLAHINSKTVQRHLHKLAEAGYLKDLTPGRRNAPHVYADTGQAEILGLVEARVGRTESPTKQEKGRTESPTGRTESPGGLDLESNPGRTLSPLKKEESREDSKKELEENGVSSLSLLWESALAEIKLNTTKASFDTWFTGTRPLRIDGHTLMIGVQNGYARDWLGKRMNGTILRVVAGLDSRIEQIEYEVPP